MNKNNIFFLIFSLLFLNYQCFNNYNSIHSINNKNFYLIQVPLFFCLINYYVPKILNYIELESNLPKYINNIFNKTTSIYKETIILDEETKYHIAINEAARTLIGNIKKFPWEFKSVTIIPDFDGLSLNLGLTDFKEKKIIFYLKKMKC